MTVQSLINEIVKNKGKNLITAARFPGRNEVLVGIDNRNRPCIFVKSNDNVSIPNVKTSNLKVEFSKKYKLLLDGKDVEENSYHSIQCQSEEKNDIITFMSIMDSFIGSSPVINARIINDMFHSLSNLFGVIPSGDFITERKGLWAELFFMRNHGGISRWAHYWHSEPTRLFDFSNANKRIEVKCTTRPERIHEFNHSQLMSLPNQKILIASYVLQEDDQGVSLKSLIDEARESLADNQDIIKLEMSVRSAGMNEAEEEGPKFNEINAARNEAWFNSIEVPRFVTEEPPGVSGTHYKSDLTGAPRLTTENITDFISDW
jgi:hypothetical protein